ncbi:MAG: RND transporter, partial [Bacteroidota bacterium]|nr:RND transporter [Bacteroidota bacterium]
FFIALRRFEKIPENLNVIVKIPFESAKNTLVLPKSAIMTNVTQNSFWVMKLINDSIAVRTDIEKGIENDSIVQILSPNLGTADRIISAGAYGLPDTAGVEIVE